MELVRGLESWAKRHGDVVNTRRFGPTCMTMAIVAPWAPSHSLELVARQAALLWAVDDALEDSSSEAEFTATLADICSAITGHLPRAQTALTAALTELRTDLAAFPLFAELGQPWTDAMTSGISAGLDEWRIARDMANGGPPPSIEEYLRIGGRSILKTAMQLAMLIVTEQESLAEHWDRLAPAVQEANIAVRLVNDYASYEREIATGDLNIRMLGVSKEQLRHDIHASVDRFRAHLAPFLAPEPLRAAVTLDRYLTAPVEFYLRTDYLS
jgi:hypothetical protein